MLYRHYLCRVTAFILLSSTLLALPDTSFAGSARIQQLYDQLKKVPSERLFATSHLYEISKAMEEDFLKLGQGQIYIERSDLDSFKAWAIKINAEYKDSETYYSYWFRYRLPAEDLEIVKASIIYNLDIRRDDVFHAYKADWTVFEYYRYYMGRTDKGMDFSRILKYTTMNNYPLLLSLLDLNVGFVMSLKPPELEFTPAMINLMAKTMEYPPEKIARLIEYLERGTLVVRVDRPDHYGRKNHFYGETFPYIRCDTSLMGNYDKDLLPLVTPPRPHDQ